MENIARVRMKTTLKSGRTSASKLFEEGAELAAPFPRIIKEEFARRPHFFEVVAYKVAEKKVEPGKTEVEKSKKEASKPKEKPSLVTV